MSKQRSDSLDALRGLAILLMVLAGSIAFGILPGWMYHAQEPPPHHIFNPDLPGITWVDLVFPFFLFSMGAAIPLSMKKRVSGGEKRVETILHLAVRYVLLIFFAVFTVHARPSELSNNPGLKENAISIGCFILLFVLYGQWKVITGKKSAGIIRAAGWIIAIAFLCLYSSGKAGLRPDNNDIIIIILANMALFGSIIWWLTREKPLLRLGVLPFVMAILLAGDRAGSMNSYIYRWTPASWMYNFYYLKYLFIIVPGMFAGEWLTYKNTSCETERKGSKMPGAIINIIILFILVCNVCCLYSRMLFLNLTFNILLFCSLYYALQRTKDSLVIPRKFINAGTYLLFLGLFFEAYEGGIKKDISTYSYYFVTAGLAFLVLTAMMIAENLRLYSGVLRFLADNGRNPMIAYTSGTLFLLPLLNITGTARWFEVLAMHPVTGFLRGVFFTGLVSVITVWFTRRKFFWKT